MVVSRSSTICEIDTFITLLSSTMMNWAAPRIVIGSHLRIAPSIYGVPRGGASPGPGDARREPVVERRTGATDVDARTCRSARPGEPPWAAPRAPRAARVEPQLRPRAAPRRDAVRVPVGRAGRTVGAGGA